MDLQGRVALVTGGGTGLGRAIAIALADAGARVAITYSRSAEAAEATEVELKKRTGGLALRSDVSDWDAVSSLVRDVDSRLGPVTVLVNNAGTTRYVPASNLDDVTYEDWRRILDVNLVGSFACVRAVVPKMKLLGEGSILNVASNSAFSFDGSSIPYVISKAALASLTHALARILGPLVRVNAVAPGWMATDWLARYMPEDQRNRVLKASIPAVSVDKVAAAALALITAEAISGQVLVVDNGEIARLGLTTDAAENQGAEPSRPTA